MVVRRTVARIVAAGYLLGAFSLLLFPLPTSVQPHRGTVTVTWANGARREEDASLVPFVTGIGGQSVMFEREGVSGETPLSTAGADAAETLKNGTLAELLRLDTSALPRLERVALYRTYGNVVYFDNGYFRYTGSKAERTSVFYADYGVLLGELKRGALQTEIQTLRITENAVFAPADLVGCNVSRAEAVAPYAVEEGAITYRSNTGVRLYAGLPLAETVRVSTVDYCDEGALVACGKLAELELPFLGERESAGGRIGYLFGKDENGAYAFPRTLKRLKVTGGGISSDSFYGCETLEKIDLCGVDPQRIAYNAFERLPALMRLHCPLGVRLPQGYKAEKAPCGCTVYTKIFQSEGKYR